MSRPFLLGILILLTVVDCGFTDFGRANHKPNDPDVRTVDDLIRQSFYQTGELLTVAKRPSKVGIAYDLSYQSGLKAIVQMEKESGVLKLLDYIYDIEDPTKKQGYNQRCKSKGLRPGFILKAGNQERKVQQEVLSSKNVPSPPLLSSLLTPGPEIIQRQLRIASGVKLNDNERNLCRQITLLKDYPVDAQLIEIKRLQGYWLFDYICDHDKDYILQYEVTFDKLGKFLLRDQRRVSMSKPKIQQTSPQRPKEPVNMRGQKVAKDPTDLSQTGKAVEKRAQKQQVPIKTSSSTANSQLDYVLIQPYEREFLPYVTSAVDALKFQLQEEADKTQLLQVYYAKKAQQITVFKLICKSDKRTFEFLYEYPKPITIAKGQIENKQVPIEPIRQQENKSKVDDIKYEPVPSQVLSLPEFAKILQNIIQKNTDGNCKVEKIDWCTEKRRLKVRATRQKAPEPFEFIGEFGDNQYEQILRAINRKAQTQPEKNPQTAIKKQKQAQIVNESSKSQNLFSDQGKTDQIEKKSMKDQKVVNNSVNYKNNTQKIIDRNQEEAIRNGQKIPSKDNFQYSNKEFTSNQKESQLTSQIEDAKTVKDANRTVKQEQKKLSFEFPEYDLKKLPFSIRQPHYLSFLTAKLQRDFMKVPVFEQFLNFLGNQKKLPNSKFAIVLMNKNKFGLHVVLENRSDNKLYQAVAEFLQKNSKYSFSIVSWKELHSLHEIAVNPFAEYYNVEKDGQLVDMLTKAFNQRSVMDKIDSLQSIQKRVAANGIYYKIVFNTKNSKQFQSQILFNPQINFANIIEYQQVDMPYDYSLEEDYPLPYNKNFVDIEDSLLKKHGSVFKNAQISYVKKSPANQKNSQKDNFRIVFYSHSGRYEVILSYDYNTRQTKIFRMEQMDQGYKLQGYSDRHTHIDKKVILQSRQYLTKLFQSIESQPYTEDKGKGPLNESFVEIDEHRNYGIYYRIGYNNPLPVVLTLFDDKRGQNPSQSLILLSGVQSIATEPINKFYSPKLFKGFIEITPSELKYNKAFPNLESTLKLKYQDILSRRNQIVGVFSKSVNNKLVYKTVYKVQDSEIYIGSCEYNSVQNRYAVLSLEKNADLTIKGTYGYGCQRIGKEQIQCLQCKKGWVNTNGRCYEQVEGCDVQIAGACYFCRNGFVRNSNNICFANPEKAINSVKSEQTTVKKSGIEEKQNQKQKQNAGLFIKPPQSSSISGKINEIPPIIVKTNPNSKPILSEFKYDKTPSVIVSGQAKESLPLVLQTRVQQPQLSSIEPQTKHKSLRRESQESSAPTSEKTLTRHIKHKDYYTQNDPNCLSYDGTVCKVCIYRFYPEGGICRKVPHSCSNYDRFTGLCTSCYSGYFLKAGNCLQTDPLCAETSSLGECSQCFRHYVLLEGRCYYESNEAIKSKLARDPLCAEYNDTNSCQRCVDGAYMDQKNVCRIADPNCEVFNQKYGLCERCMRGYEQVRGKCLNKRHSWRDQS